MKAQVLALDGKAVREMELPAVFETEYDPKLIKRAVLSIQTQRLQPKGPNPRAGRNYTAQYYGNRHLPATRRGINIGRARRPRTRNRRAITAGDVRGISGALKGPKAHPPKAEAIIAEKINRKEKILATRSAIAATANPKIVSKRGHRIEETTRLPIIVEDKFGELAKTKEVMRALKQFKVGNDLERARNARTIRAGKGKKRGRKYKKRKSVLIVVAGKSQAEKSARNIEGVDVTSVRELNAEMLAPGAVAGRLVVWTEGAIKGLSERFGGERQ